MAPIIEGPPDDNEPSAGLGRRLGAFVAIWVLSLAAVAIVSYLLRGILFAAR